MPGNTPVSFDKRDFFAAGPTKTFREGLGRGLALLSRVIDNKPIDFQYRILFVFMMAK